MTTLITILVILIAALILVLLMGYFIAKNNRQPEVQRKWTDPKFHD